MRLLLRPQLRVQVEQELEAEVEARSELEEQHQAKIIIGVFPSSLSLRLMLGEPNFS